MTKMIGEKIHRWTVLENTHHTFFLCRCDCGTLREVRKADLVHNKSKSCGCLRGDIGKRLWTTHGLSHKHPLYNMWKNMRRRCYSPVVKSYVNYGARGIKMSDDWKNFANFVRDMEQDWIEAKKIYNQVTIERIDNDGDYCKENCKWIDKKEQSLNQRSNIKVNIDSKQVCLAEANRLHNNLEYGTLLSRIRRGWELNKAILTPLTKAKKNNQTEV